MKTTDFLSRLEGVRPNGSGFMALCPGHNDHEPSLSITEVDGKILLYCHGGCELGDILKPLNLKASDLFSDRGGERHTPVRQGCQPVNTPGNHVQKGLTASVSTVSTGVNLATMAGAKRLPIDFLKSLGMGDTTYNRQSAVRIPYYSEEGQEDAVRFRLALSGDSRFKWRKGDRAMPYGLSRLEQIRKAGWVLVVEGESDCWTCWFHDIPALGAPGKGVWPVPWGEYLKGLDTYVWQEPEAEDFVLRVLKSAPDLRYIRAPNGIKDISEAHIQGLTITTWFEGLKIGAESGQALKARYDNERLAQLYKEAEAVIQAEDPLGVVKDAIRGLGYGGDLKPALIVYLAATSRLLAMREGTMPVHLLLTGVSSSGKSYTLNLIKKLLPEAAHLTIDAGSPRTVIYNDADLQHRLLVFGEADSLPAGEDNPAASAIRNLLQDHSLHYEVTIRDPDTGDFTVRKVEKPGPTVLITTSTRSLRSQLMTRLFRLEIGDSKEQIGAALETQAALELEGAQPLDGALVAFQGYLQLRAPLNVIVPFAGELARSMGKTASAPRILRDFARLLSLIKSAAVIRHHWRRIDKQGRIIATLEDYQTIRELVNEMYVDSSSGATGDVRAIVEAVKALGVVGGERITNSTLSRHLSLSVKQASRRAARAIKQGWLVNREQRKSYPANYETGEPMPETEGLPLLTVDRVDRVDTETVLNSSFKNGRVDTLTPLTNDNIHYPPPGIPCVKAGGGCGLRTDPDKTFDCINSPQTCSYFMASSEDSTSQLSFEKGA